MSIEDEERWADEADALAEEAGAARLEVEEHERDRDLAAFADRVEAERG